MTFQVPANSAYYQTTIDLTQQFGYDVDVTATIDERTGIATWIFTTIDPATGADPARSDRWLLPPDNASGVGEGFVSYTVMANQSDPTGTVINAQATVTFDTQPPLNTPQIFNTIDAGTGLSSSVAPLPAYERRTVFDVSWSGTDASDGSAIASYTIYVSDDGGPYTAWLTNTTLTAAPFVGQDGHTYSFYSVATDNAGNVEPVPTSAQATTLVDVTPPTCTVNPLSAETTATSFTVSVTGSDPTSPGGTPSGVASYAIYVSTDGGAFTLFTTVPASNPTTTFTGQAGNTYGFYSIATDNAGNVQLTPSAAQATTEIVSPVDTTTSLQSSEDPSKLGDSVTFTATVTPATTTNGTPTGSVQFSIDGAAAGGPVPLTEDGTATLTTSELTIGSHTVTTDYINTDGYFITSSGTLAAGQVVNTADTTAVAGSTTTTTVFGQSVTFTASVAAVTSGLPIPTGSVEFLDGSTDLATETLDAFGNASFTTSALTAATHSIIVQYMGDLNFSASMSSALAQTVNQAGTAVALVSSPFPSVYGQMVTLTATIGVVAPGAGTPSGTVAFQEGSIVLDTETLGDSGTVNFTTSALAVGANSITAVYSGDFEFRDKLVEHK